MSTDIMTNASSYLPHTSEDEITQDFAYNTTASDQVVDIFIKYDFVSFMRVFCPLANDVDRVVTVIWYIIGFSGNIVSAKIWLEKRMRVNNSSAIYLATLSISDLLFLILHTLQESQYAWGHNTLNHKGLCEIYFMFYLVFQYLSPILVSAFTCERWIAVCHPFDKEKYCTTRRALKVVALLVFMCLCLGSMQAYLWQYDETTKRCGLDENNTKLWTIWTWITEMLVFLLVPLVILIFNIFVIREVRNLSRNGQRMLPANHATPSHSPSAATTVMLLSVSFYVIITVLPATIVYAIVGQFPEGNTLMTEDQIRNDPTWQKYLTYLTLRKFIEEICISHYACNIFLYIITGPQFRRSLQRTFQRIIPSKYIKEDSFATMNTGGTHKTSIRNLYTAVSVNGKTMTKV